MSDKSEQNNSNTEKIMHFLKTTTKIIRILRGVPKTFEEEQEEAGFQKTKVITERDANGNSWKREIWEHKQ